MAMAQMAMAQWCSPPAGLKLVQGEVHVWRASLEREPWQIQALTPLLSSDESQRADRFVREPDRHHFIAARGILRLLLSRYLGVEPTGLQFTYNSYGKPALVLGEGWKPLCFNLSHSQGLALYAVTLGQEVGIDLERIRPEMDYQSIAERFFAPQEAATLLALPMTERCFAFFQTWTCKEAYIKARGGALYQALTQVELDFSGDRSIPRLRVEGEPEAAHHWTLMPLEPGSDYAGALAIATPLERVTCWQWPLQFESYIPPG